MNVLLVYSHPNPKSFNHAIKEQTEKQLNDQGHKVRIRDLYDAGFHPVLSANDFDGIRSGSIPADIKAEQEHVAWADTLIMVHPVWWTGLPAMLKGYIDRVFSFGFAYVYGDDGPKGLLQDKKVLIVTTTGAPFEYYQENGMHHALKRTIDEGIYEFCGITVIDHLFYGAVPAVTDEVRRGYLDDLSHKIAEYFGK